MNEEGQPEPTLAAVLQRLAELSAKVAQLEDRVKELEGGSTPLFEPGPRPVNPSFTMVAAPAAVGKDELVTAIGLALDELGGEADVGAIRSHLAKKGMISVTRSDVNKALYNRKDLFQTTRQEQMKPIWQKVMSNE